MVCKSIVLFEYYSTDSFKNHSEKKEGRSQI